MRKNELMPAQKLEKVHRRALATFNHRHLADAMYYRDTILDPEIMPLVKILNNEWTVTTFSYGGHWDKPSKFQYPYVCFFVFNQQAQWLKITQRTWQILADKVNDRATIQVSYYFYVPEQEISSMAWYLGPSARKQPWIAKKLYHNERNFRRIMNSLITDLCNALNSATIAIREREA